MGDAKLQQYAEQLQRQKNFLALVGITFIFLSPHQVPC